MPALAIIFVLGVVAAQAAQAQTFTVLHNFTGGQDGARPQAGLTMDRAGNLYGTAFEGGGGNCSLGGVVGCGTAFRLSYKGSGRIFTPLYSFQAGNDGSYPQARVIIGPDGALYGTTLTGGTKGCYSGYGGYGCGTVFKLTPSPTACKTALCPWTENVLYRFTNSPDGRYPGYGDVVFDQVGNLYGTTTLGGNPNGGTVFQLTPSNGGWTKSVLYSFTGGLDGAQPYAGVIFNQAGNLYGTTYTGGEGNCLQITCGVVYKLTPSNGGWTESVLYSFTGGSDGGNPYAGVIFDQASNLYGTTWFGGLNCSGGSCGLVYELTPSNGGWTESVPHYFTGSDGANPYAGVIFDQAGNLYGATPFGGAYEAGAVFKLTPSSGGWTYTSLHDFTGGSDGWKPWGGVVLDQSGNIYGTTAGGGAYGYGVVWEITP